MTTAAPAREARPLVTSGGAVMGRARVIAQALLAAAARIARPVLRWLRTPTALGWGLLATALLLLVAGLVLGWGEFLAIGIAGVLVLLLAVPFVLGRMAFAVRIDLASPRVVVGESAVGRLVVRNTARGTTAPAAIVLPVGAARAEFRTPRLEKDAEHEELFQVPTQRRAILVLGPVTSERSDPLGVLRRRVDWTEPTELFVHPRTIPLTGETTGLLRDLEGLPTRDLADDDVSFHALREYTPGDDLRYVHWKSTARTQTLMIRQFEQTRRSRLVIVLSTRGEDYTDAEEFELAVSIAGSIGVSALRAGESASVLTSRELLVTPTAGRLLDALSGVEREEEAPGIVEVAGTLRSQTPGASIVVFITGQGVSVRLLHGAAVRVPPGAQAAALRAVGGGELARRVVGGMAVVDVPELSTLRMGMRAVSA